MRSEIKSEVTPPVGIIKTLPKEFFKNYKYGGLCGFEYDFLAINNREEDYWIFNLQGKPKYKVLYFYLLYDGAIRYRANILGYTAPNTTFNCADGTVKHGKIWVQVGPPVIKLNPPVPMKGFQGFRYTSNIY